MGICERPRNATCTETAGCVERDDDHVGVELAHFRREMWLTSTDATGSCQCLLTNRSDGSHQSHSHDIRERNYSLMLSETDQAVVSGQQDSVRYVAVVKQQQCSSTARFSVVAR